MDKELFWFLPSIGWALWIWGGYNWKPARWAFWPLVAAIATFISGIGLLRSLFLFLGMATVLNLGYGDDSKALKLFKYKWIVWIVFGLLYALSLLPVAASAWGWLVVIAIYFPMGAAFSQKWWPKWTWKLVEGFTGLWQGCAIAWAIVFH